MNDFMDHRWQLSGVPKRIRQIVGNGVDDTEAVNFTRSWVAKRENDSGIWCLALSSSKGAGKSVAAGLAMHEIGPRPVESKNNVGVGSDIPAWWPSSKFARLSGYDGVFDKICQHEGLVVIDDLGTEFMDAKGWLAQAVDAFIDTRYGEFLPTIITTNLNAEQFKSRYSERVVDRLREGGSFFEFAGKSLRCNDE